MEITFTMDVKEQLGLLTPDNSDMLAETSAFLKVAASFDKELIVFIVENENVYDRFKKFIEERYKLKLFKEEIINTAFNKNILYRCVISEKVMEILEDLSIYKNGKILNYPEEHFLGDDELKISYLRGSFLGKGVINDPKTSRYHLEITVDRAPDSVFLQRLFNYFNLNSRIIKREEKFMVYIKEADKISDFLKMIGAHKAVLYYENIRIYREEKNAANRLNNMEQANVEKAMHSAMKQLDAIEFIERELGLDYFDNKLKDAAEYRIRYPEYSLNELSKIMEKDGIKITKSGLNHRFRKIVATASRMRKNKNFNKKD